MCFQSEKSKWKTGAEKNHIFTIAPFKRPFIEETFS